MGKGSFLDDYDNSKYQSDEQIRTMQSQITNLQQRVTRLEGQNEKQNKTITDLLELIKKLAEIQRVSIW